MKSSTTQLAVAIVCSFLVQCTTIDSAKKASIKKMVVACNVGNELTRHQIGFTAFGNKSIEPEAVPKLKAGVTQILKEELQGKFPEVVFVPEEPPMDHQSIFKTVDYDSWIKELARKHQADAVFMVAGRYYYPYESPSYMQARGMGIWHSGNNARVQCYTWIFFKDSEGKLLGNHVRLSTGQMLPSIPFKERFSDYTPNEQDRIISRCLDEFRVEISSFVKGVGL